MVLLSVDNGFSNVRTYVNLIERILPQKFLERLAETGYRVVLTANRDEWKEKYEATNNVVELIGFDTDQTGWQLQTYAFDQEIVRKIRHAAMGHPVFNVLAAEAYQRYNNLDLALLFAKKALVECKLNPDSNWTRNIQDKLEQTDHSLKNFPQLTEIFF